MAEWIKPRRCPRCLQQTVLEVIFGYPDIGLFEAAERGEAVIGGCIVEPPVTGRRVECTTCAWQGILYRRHLIDLASAFIWDTVLDTLAEHPSGATETALWELAGQILRGRGFETVPAELAEDPVMQTFWDRLNQDLFGQAPVGDSPFR